MKPFLVLQLRPEDAAADGEFAAILEKGHLDPNRVHRIRLDQTDVPKDLALDAYAAVIIGGGPGCVSDDPQTRDPLEARMEAAALNVVAEVVARDTPFLGCCAGIGLLAHALGARVDKSRYGESIGPSSCSLTDAGRTDPILARLPTVFHALVGHKEAVQELPDGCVHLVSSDACPYQMIRYGSNVYATQFHPEADGPEFEKRIKIYEGYGYFDPADSETLIASCYAKPVTVPNDILARFVARFG